MDPTLVTPENIETFAKLAVDAAQQGNSGMLLSLALVGVIWGVRKFLGPKVPFLQTQAGGALLTLGTAFGGGLASSLASGQKISGPIALGALKVAFTAAGGWTLIKHLLSAFQPDAKAIKLEAVKAGEQAGKDAKILSITDIVDGDKK